jgi:tRNA threonylcarbamoyladenosine biosynthesis protein TsaE
VGACIARLLRAGDVVLLVGPLGAGKTTLVQGLVAAIGGEQMVTSPTFTLAHTYQTTPPVTHVDLWRLEHLQEIVDLGLEEVLDSGGAVLAEWGEAAEPLYGSDALIVRLERGAGDDERSITLEARGPSWSSRAVEPRP